MANQKQSEKAKVDEILHVKPSPPPPEPVLGSAAESGDPVVHQLLAQRDIADRNGDKDAVKAATAALAGLGVA